MTRLKIALLALILLAILAILAVVWWMPEPEPYRLTVAPGGMERIAAKLKYHGVKSAVCDPSGCFFVRDGKRIKL